MCAFDSWHNVLFNLAIFLFTSGFRVRDLHFHVRFFVFGLCFGFVCSCLAVAYCCLLILFLCPIQDFDRDLYLMMRLLVAWHFLTRWSWCFFNPIKFFTVVYSLSRSCKIWNLLLRAILNLLSLSVSRRKTVLIFCNDISQVVECFLRFDFILSKIRW